jgi:sugar/nucleoside kinase (ribokinase family)
MIWTVARDQGCATLSPEPPEPPMSVVTPPALRPSRSLATQNADAPRVIVVGDVLDDIIVAPAGRALRGTDTTARIRHRAGGAAANTAAWLGAEGVRVDFLGRVGSGDEQRHAQLLVDAGVTPRLSSSPREPTGTVIITLDGGVGSMLTDRGASASLDLDSLTADILVGASVVHLTGYSIVHAPTAEAFSGLASRVRTAGALLSVDPASAGFIAEYGPAAFLELVAGSDLFFPSLDEGRLLTGLADPDEIVRELGRSVGVVALTLPDGGVVAGRRGAKIVHGAPAATRLVDPVGSGDAFSAGFIAGWLHSPSVALSARRGAKAAGLARAVVGGRPSR